VDQPVFFGVEKIPQVHDFKPKPVTTDLSA
jgi:hypothetical protein